jgi:hypothetical protein
LADSVYAAIPRIEAAASQKFDACGVEVEERYEEQRVLRVQWSDL